MPAKAGIQNRGLMTKGGYVYILASKRNGTLYVGVTSNLEKRMYQHLNLETKGFTAKYDVHRLVWFEEHSTIEDAIYREKQIEKWNRKWKLDLIEKVSPKWKDLSIGLFDWIPDQVGNDGEEGVNDSAEVGNDGGIVGNNNKKNENNKILTRHSRESGNPESGLNG